MSKELPPSRVAEQFVVRFPDGMRDRIAGAAKANNRSMNAEIVARLEESFAPKPLSKADVEYERLYQLQAQLDVLSNRDMLISMRLSAFMSEWNQAKASGDKVREVSLAQQIEHFQQDWHGVRKRMELLRIGIQDQQLKADEASREQLAFMDVQIDRMLQSELEGIHKLEEELNIPEEKRIVNKR